VAARVAPGDVPLNLIETPNGVLISTNSGYGPQYLLAYDIAHAQVSDRRELGSLWYGLDYEPKHNWVLASSGNHSVYVVPLEEGKFQAAREIALEGCELTAGLAVLDQAAAVVACNQTHRLLKFDIPSGKVLGSTTVGEYPYAVKPLPAGRLAVSTQGKGAITILSGSDLKPLAEVRVGSHPSDLLVLPENNQLLVACSDSDLISVIDLKSLKEVRRVNIQIPGSSLGGAQPDALAFDRATGRLYVALAAIDALAVFHAGHDADDGPRFQGLLPVGAYPAALLHSVSAHKLFIADGRNPAQGPSDPARLNTGAAAGPHAHRADSGSALDYIGYLIGGGIESLADVDFEGLRTRMVQLADRVYGVRPNAPSPEQQRVIDTFSAKNPHNPIRHVIYIIKENRTYDQVLGDVREGNGKPDLVLFGGAVTPNQHALARKFVLFDDFYVDGDVSADGHFWSTAAEATDYIRKLWPSTYSEHIKMDIFGGSYDGDERHDHPVAAPASGFIWDAAAAAHLAYRDYGEWCVDDKEHPGRSKAWLRGLQGHYDPDYLDGIGEVTDQTRIDEWEREFHQFEKSGDLPSLTVIHLPNDHTQGTRVGKPTPRAMVADNDLALGRLVETVSHSRFWSSTAIFVLEDDAQDGPDHVDAHRSPLLIISPYVHHGAVEHAHFSTVSVLKTVEQILGLPSLTYFDDRAPTLLTDFQQQPNLDPYTVIRARVNLDELNAANAPGARESERWDFSRVDVAPEQELNRVIWQSVKGKESEPPAPVLSVRFAAARVGVSR
jgi:hypothetical protein